MWSGLLVRFPTPDDNGRAAGPSRAESCPPAMPPALPGWANRLMDWLAQGSYAASARIGFDDDTNAPAGVTPLASVRLEFIDCLDDVATRQAADLAERIACGVLCASCGTCAPRCSASSLAMRRRTKRSRASRA